MEKKLSNAQARIIVSVIRERDAAMAEYGEAIEELVAAWAGDFKNPVIQQKPDGFYIIEMEQPEEPEKGEKDSK